MHCHEDTEIWEKSGCGFCTVTSAACVTWRD